jgi:hypothetical protein
MPSTKTCPLFAPVSSIAEVAQVAEFVVFALGSGSIDPGFGSPNKRIGDIGHL